MTGGVATPGPRIELRPLGTAPLLTDYVQGRAALASCYAGHPFDRGAYVRKAADIDRRFAGGGRAGLRAYLKPVSAAASQRLDRVIEEHGYVVTTGQQCGLFTGPLYTIYKALTAVRLADALETELGRPVLPVFWSAAEDHDFAEVRTAALLTTGDAVTHIELAVQDGDAPVSMARHRLGAEADAACAALAAALPATAHGRTLSEQVRHAYQPGRTMAAAFEVLLTELLGEFPLCVVSAADPALKLRTVPIIERELEHAAAHAERVARQTSRLEALGYATPVTLARGASNLLFEDAAGRERLLQGRDGWQLRRTKRRFSTAELRARLAADPACLSPNVLLRPIAESAALPTLAYVGGPAEIGYFGQIGCLFRAFDIEPPLVFPRMSASLVERRIARLLEKLGLTGEDVSGSSTAELTARVLDSELPVEMTAALDALRRGSAEAWSRTIHQATVIDPTLEAPLRRHARAVQQHADAAEKKVRAHHRLRHRVRARQIARVVSHLRPGGTPQERTLNVLPFLACHGPALLHDVAAACEVGLQDGDRWQGPGCTH